MGPLLLILTLLLQGIPPLPNRGGSVTGVVKTADGKPAANVRVVAMIPPDSPQDVAGIASMAALTESDENGLFRLENVPVGRYLIAAGRIDSQTYYPGYIDVAKAAKILVTEGNNASGINFVLNDSSGGRAYNSFSFTSVPTAYVPFTISGAKIPVSFPGGLPQLVLTNINDGQRNVALMDSPSVLVRGTSGSASSNESYTVTLVNLPPGFSIKSITSGPVDLLKNPLQVAVGNASVVATFGTSVSPSAPLPLFGQPAPPPILNSKSISIELSYVAPSVTGSGVRVSGKYNGVFGARFIYMSNIQGTTYLDGTFEFLGIPPGRHAIFTRSPNNAKPLGKILVVGDSAVGDVQLEEIAVLPMEVVAQPQADSRLSGTTPPMPSLSGRVVDEADGAAISQGIVFLSGQERISFRLQPDGTFQIPHLLPGRYKLEIQVFGYNNVSRDLEISEADVYLEFRSASFDAK